MFDISIAPNFGFTEATLAVLGFDESLFYGSVAIDANIEIEGAFAILIFGAVLIIAATKSRSLCLALRAQNVRSLARLIDFNHLALP
ncbi:MAG: hypothetical protein JOZ57_18395 [Abitibacteriaceae bacterium]|nr:hypothetical protein [Abditibacteriaceae bacterium]